MQEGRVVGHGYNGALPGAPSCLLGACPRGLLKPEECAPGSDYSNCVADHAERNALRLVPQAQREGSTVYISSEPCQGCRTLMTSMNVARAVWPGGEADLQENR